ncbi:MAG: alkaline phosphatase [Fimbriimonadaceae bacterium]|nr:alkaline phosphatase [Fimbriimonadaceae bacterium]
MIKTSFGILAVALTGMAVAAPKIRVMPYDGARFLAGQMFDVRVEFTPSQPGRQIVEPMLMIAGKSVPVVLDAANGFTIRAYRLKDPSHYTIEATAKESGDNQTTRTSIGFRIEQAGGNKRRIKNIIICLGDGMGMAHRTAARIVRYGVKNGIPQGFLNMDRMPGYGAVSTHSLDSFVTDSAPGMTGYVSGNHNDNGSEGVYPDNTKDAFDNPRIEYLSQFLHRTYGTSLGIVTTADIEDATPASQMVHTYDRGKGTGICNQFFAERNRSGLKVLMGGGRKWFLPEGQFGSSRAAATNFAYATDLLSSGWNPGGNTIDTSAMSTSTSLIDSFKRVGFGYVDSATALKSVPADATKLLGLFAYGNMNVSMEKIAKRRNPTKPGAVDDYFAPDQPMLDEMAEAALKVLDNNNRTNGNRGFNLLIEGAHIDKQSHAMDADRAIWEVLEFDRAVGKAIEYAKTHDDTIVLVLADHECSGFSLVGALKKSMSEMQALPSDRDKLGPDTHPARQAAVGTYEGAGFPHYPILADGFPLTANIDRKLVVGFGAGADRYEDWLSNAIQVYDGSAPK